MKDAVLRFRCESELIKRFNKIAELERRTPPDLARIIIEDFVKLKESQIKPKTVHTGFRHKPITGDDLAQKQAEDAGASYRKPPPKIEATPESSHPENVTLLTCAEEPPSSGQVVLRGGPDVQHVEIPRIGSKEARRVAAAPPKSAASDHHPKGKKAKNP